LLIRIEKKTFKFPLNFSNRFDGGQSLDVSEDQRTYNALVKLIRKLRWIGMDDEAARVQMTLTANAARPADSVIASPRDTD